MRSYHKVKQLLTNEPEGPRHQILSALLLSLQDDGLFRLNDLYLLPDGDLQLAISLIGEWQLDRYYMGKAKPFQATDQAADK